jgi:hypothetical protein
VLERLEREADGLGPDTNSPARIKAAELIGKHIGMWREGEGDDTGFTEWIKALKAL